MISFDFDFTLARKDVQEFCKDLLIQGYDVYITTARYDDDNVHKWDFVKDNNDLYAIADELGISRDKIHFTNMKPKAEYLATKEFIWHLDDDQQELENIKLANLEMKGISVITGNWKHKCKRLLR